MLVILTRIDKYKSANIFHIGGKDTVDIDVWFYKSLLSGMNKLVILCSYFTRNKIVRWVLIEYHSYVKHFKSF